MCKITILSNISFPIQLHFQVKTLILRSNSGTMKKLFIIMFVGLLAQGMNGQTKEEILKDFTGPVFEFESEVIDYGEIAANSDGNRVFKFPVGAVVFPGGKGVQHAVIGTKIDHVTPVFIAGEELGIGKITIQLVIIFRRPGH